MRALLLAAGLLLKSRFAPARKLLAPIPAPLTIARQGSFFIGGRDVKSDTLSTLPAYAASGTINRRPDVRALPGARGACPGVPITLIHGCCLTRQDLGRRPPDGRMGWDEYFVRHDHPRLRDRPDLGAAASRRRPLRHQRGPQRQGCRGSVADRVLRRARERLEHLSFRQGISGADARHALFPVAAQAEFWKQMVPDSLNSLPTPNPTVPGAFGNWRKKTRRHRADESFPIGHLPVSDPRCSAAKASRAWWLSSPAPVPHPTDDMTPLCGIADSWCCSADYVRRVFPRWAPRLKNCRAFVAAANAAGGQGGIAGAARHRRQGQYPHG